MTFSLLTDLWQPARFFVGNGLRCAWEFEAERTVPWELFRGRLLREEQTRAVKTFLTWNLYPVEGGAVSNEPLLSLLYDEAVGEIHATRGLRCRVWSAIDSADGIASRPREAWVRERIATVDAADPDLADEIAHAIVLAVEGVSRLPLMSMEAPLSQFTFGQLAYLGRERLDGFDPVRPRRAWRDLLAAPSRDLDERRRAKRFEFLLRAAPAEDLTEVADSLADWLGAERLHAAFLRAFNDVSLSPYTDFVDRALAVAARWSDVPAFGVAGEIDLLAALTLRIARHLAAYDLTLFHYRGANFPDALLLDALTRRLVERIEARPDLFAGAGAVSRRRAFRAACLLRAQYEGHAVPDRPTSPGENERVLPEPFAPVPDEQIEEPHRRTRRLYDDAPLDSLLTPASRLVLAEAMRDLRLDAESREGGVALFVDRPLGYFKAAAEVDQTPLVSYIAFSRRLATRKLLDARALGDCLGLDVPESLWAEAEAALASMAVVGLPVDAVPEPRRPSVTLADARKVSDDFVALRTTAESLGEFRSALGVESTSWTLVARTLDARGQPIVAAFDGVGRRVAEFEADWSQGAIIRRGVEIPRAGLRPAAPACEPAAAALPEANFRSRLRDS